MQALSLKDVRFRYAGMSGWALDIPSLEIGRGEFVTVLGPNGAGKTTLSFLANGLIPKSIKGEFEGSVEVFSHRASEYSVAQLSTLVGMVFQEPESQLFCMSAEEEVAFGPENLAVPREEIARRVEWALELAGLKGMNDRSPSTLSGGQKQRLAIAAALSMKPSMLVLDEPAYALDPVGRIELYTILSELKARHGMTVVVMERDAEDLARFSDRFAVMVGGRVTASGTPSEVLGDPEILRSAGVSPPQMAEVAAMMSARRKGPPLSFLTVEEAVAEIMMNAPRHTRTAVR
ncbi:MAG: energy-coupling factor ABC transporter ATP-binding protein [Thermoplasmata archaeon]